MMGTATSKQTAHSEQHWLTTADYRGCNKFGDYSWVTNHAGVSDRWDTDINNAGYQRLTVVTDDEL